MNYTELKANISDCLHRADLTDKLDLFIDLAEAFLFRELVAYDLEAVATGTIAGSMVTFPSDFGALASLTLTYGGKEYALDHTGSINGEGYIFQDGGIRLTTIPATGTGYTMYYTPVLLALSSTNLTNWIMVNAPDLYLSACNFQGAKYVGDTSGMQLYGAETQTLIDSLQRSSKRRQALRGSLQIKPR